MPETLPVSERRSLKPGGAPGAFRQTITNRQTFGYAPRQAACRARCLPPTSSSQQLFTEIYHSCITFRWRSRPSRSVSLSRDFLNARLVGRLGMRMISHSALVAGSVAIGGIMLVAAKLQMLPLAPFMTLSALMMSVFGMMRFRTRRWRWSQPHRRNRFIALRIDYHAARDRHQAWRSARIKTARCCRSRRDSSTPARRCALVVEKGRLFKPHVPVVN